MRQASHTGCSRTGAGRNSTTRWSATAGRRRRTPCAAGPAGVERAGPLRPERAHRQRGAGGRHQRVSRLCCRRCWRMHPEVAECIVRPMRADEGARLKAFVVPRGGSAGHGATARSARELDRRTPGAVRVPGGLLLRPGAAAPAERQADRLDHRRLGIRKASGHERKRRTRFNTEVVPSSLAQGLAKKTSANPGNYLS